LGAKVGAFAFVDFQVEEIFVCAVVEVFPTAFEDGGLV
jgi:hypothetical protein